MRGAKGGAYSEDGKVRAEFAACRTIAHSWRFSDVHRDGHNFVQVLACGRCPVERHMTINGRSGAVMKSRYTYPPGYLIHGGVSPDMRAGLRLDLAKGLAS